MNVSAFLKHTRANDPFICIYNAAYLDGEPVALQVAPGETFASAHVDGQCKSVAPTKRGPSDHISDVVGELSLCPLSSYIVALPLPRPVPLTLTIR